MTGARGTGRADSWNGTGGFVPVWAVAWWDADDRDV